MRSPHTGSATRRTRRPGVFASSRGGGIFFLLYNLFMNKRAKKRLKQAIEKDKQERAKTPPQQPPGSSRDPQQLRGFLPKPAKKRG